MTFDLHVKQSYVITVSSKFNLTSRINPEEVLGGISVSQILYIFSLVNTHTYTIYN